MKISPQMLAKDALASLETYAFLGNVRELEYILEHAITLNFPRGHARNVITLTRFLNSTNLNVSGLAIW
jgi:transcriptional regulator with GAF, ATPase, and Fis domain